jgi:hypothetical protein
MRSAAKRAEAEAWVKKTRSFHWNLPLCPVSLTGCFQKSRGLPCLFGGCQRAWGMSSRSCRKDRRNAGRLSPFQLDNHPIDTSLNIADGGSSGRHAAFGPFLLTHGICSPIGENKLSIPLSKDGSPCPPSHFHFHRFPKNIVTKERQAAILPRRLLSVGYGGQ